MVIFVVVIVPGGCPGRRKEELESTFRVERVSDFGKCHGTKLVQGEVTLKALVIEANSSFMATTTIERDISVIQLKLMPWMNRVKHLFFNLHFNLLFFAPS